MSIGAMFARFLLGEKRGQMRHPASTLPPPMSSKLGACADCEYPGQYHEVGDNHPIDNRCREGDARGPVD